jgi:hypothetical protein
MCTRKLKGERVGWMKERECKWKERENRDMIENV